MNKISINNASSKLHGFAPSRLRAFALSFRFQRWSRVGYAMFRSLSLCVTIGQLSKDICEKAFHKLKGASQGIFAFVLSENDFADENTEHDEQLIKQYQLEQLLINYADNSSSSASVVVVVFFISFLAVAIRIFLLQPLFFIHNHTELHLVI